MTLESVSTSTPSRPKSTHRPRTRRPRNSVEGRVFNVLRWATIAVLVLASLFPFYYMFLLSVRDLSSVALDPARLWLLPQELNFQAYMDVLLPVESGGQGFLSMIGTSATVALATVALTLLVAVPGAYAVSRLRFIGHRKIGGLFLAVYLFPAMLLAVPLFVFFTKLGLRGQLWVLIIVYVAQTIAVAIFMLRNYFDTIPVSIEEAAALDGLGRLQTLRLIILPLSLPSMMSTALFVFMIAWNEFLFALLFLVEDRNAWTVSLGLSQLSDNLEIPPTLLMAGSVVLTIPIIIIFFTTERLL